MIGNVLTPSQIEAIRARAAAEIALRERQGVVQADTDKSPKPHTDYQTRPLDWIVEKLGIPRETLVWSLAPEYAHHQWDGDKDPLIIILDALARGEDVGVESATGTGKSFLCACIVLWFLACFPLSEVVTVAPKEAQLLKAIWKEIGGLWSKFEVLFPEAELTVGRIRMQPNAKARDKWTAYAFVCGVGADEESAVKAQGFHAKHMLIITEETPGIHPAIMNSLFNTRTDDHNIQLSVGNPDHRQDELHKFCEQDDVVPVRISALDHPNIVTGRAIVPGTFGRDRLAKRIKKLGVGSRLYESRIRGISPAESSEALIKWEWCEQAAKRWADEQIAMALRAQAGQALGADVANSERGDRAAISRWQGAVCTEVVDFPCPDSNILGRDLAMEARANDIPGKHIGVDSVGVGAGAMNEGKRLGIKFKDISGGKKAIPQIDQPAEQKRDENGQLLPKNKRVVEYERYDNMRSQVWWQLREDLRLGRIALPYDVELFKDLTILTWGTANGKIWVLSKEDAFKDLKRSPNKGDAVAYGNWARPRRAVKPQEEEQPGPSRTVDNRLERILAERQKQQDRLNRMIERRFKKLGRMKKRLR